MMTASLSLGGSLFVLLIVDICSLPLEKGSNPSTQYSITNANTADNLASNQRGTLTSLTPGLVPYSPQYRGVLVPAYVSSSVSQPTQAGGYTAGSTLTGGSNVGASSSRSNTQTAGDVALTRGGLYPYQSSVVVPYNTQYGGLAVQQPGVSQYAAQSMPVLYTGSSSSGPAQAGGYMTGSTQVGGAAQPAAGSNVGFSTGGSGTNTGANVALSQGGLYAYPSSVAVPYSAPYGGVAVQQPGLSQYAAQSVPAPYASSSLSAPAQAGGSTAGSAQTGVTSQPAAEINWAVPPPKLGEESSPNPQSLASSTTELGSLPPPVPAYQPGELSHYEKAAEAGDYQSETEELGRRTVPAAMDTLATAGGLASPVFSTGQFGMGGLWGSPYPSFDYLFLTGQYPVGTVSHFSQDYEQGRDYSHSTHYLKDQPYSSLAQSAGTVGAAHSLQTPSFYVSSPVAGGYYQVGAQMVPAPSYTGVPQIKY